VLQQALKSCEDHLLDRIEVRRVFRQEDELDASDVNEIGAAARLSITTIQISSISRRRKHDA
jgi:hypothetical protein